MQRKIKLLERKSLSNKDIERLCPNVNIVSYPDLYQFDTLDDLLGKEGACVILYKTSENYGHWCCIIKINPNLVEFFDPYGIFIDDEFDFMSYATRIEVGQTVPYVSQLLYNCPYKLSFNEYKFQQQKKNVNTCGRWTALRVIYKKLPLNEFKKMFISKKYDPDFISTLMTYFI
jgi:hypothetical protein